ncbi:MAG: hypothetical protein QM773_11740 [Hyphomonadaceae bacterium]
MARAAAPMTLATLLIAAPSALAQDPDPSATLTNGVRCSPAYAREDIEANIRKLTMPVETVLATLNLVSADAQRCVAIRDAATELAASPDLAALAGPDPAAARSQAMVAQTLADADSKAGQLKFEVGPPPRNMTNERPGSQ